MGCSLGRCPGDTLNAKEMELITEKVQGAKAEARGMPKNGIEIDWVHVLKRTQGTN